jgi:hypothetical protein
MRNAKKKANKIPTLKVVKCPACGKPRMKRYVKDDGTIDLPSDRTIDVRGEVRYVEACQFCLAKYQRRDEQYLKNNMERIAKAMQDRKNSDDEEFYLDEL